MANTLADVPGIQQAANQTAYRHGELKAHLNGLTGCHSDLITAYQGQTGDAINSTLDDTITKGNNLAQSLQAVIDAMNAAHVKFSSSDEEQKGLVAGAHEDFSAGDHTALGEVTGPVVDAPKADLNF